MKQRLVNGVDDNKLCVQNWGRFPMEQEILHTLNEIRGILYALLTIVSFVLFVWILRGIQNIFISFKQTWENDFITRADKLFESAEFEKLTQHCQEKLNKYPNHSNATWWLARAKQETGDQLEAKALFERLLELDPGWNETHIEPYLKKLST